FRNASDGTTFTTAKTLVPECLDLCDTLAIRQFFRKSWRYMDGYSKGLDARQAAFAVKKYKFHRRIEVTAEVLARVSNTAGVQNNPPRAI
ncbi:hypothetical protein K503DRAFT_697887, partial [Rhizopogon vinicolor AM-OR11-026]